MLERLRTESEAKVHCPSSEPNEELSVSDVFAFLRFYWPLVATTAFFSVILGLGYVLTKQPSYTATAQVLIEAHQQTSPTLPISDSQVAMDTPQVESQMAVLRSGQITGKVAQYLEKRREKAAGEPAKTDSMTDKDPTARAATITREDNGAGNNAGREEGKSSPSKPSGVGWLFWLLFGSPEAESDARLRAEIQEIQDNMDVKRIGLSYVLDLSFRAKDPDTAAFVANAIGDAYVQDKLDVQAQSARQGGIWLETRIEDLRHLMNEAALDVQEFKAKRDYRLIDRSEKHKFDIEKGEGPLGIEPKSKNEGPLDPESKSDDNAGKRPPSSANSEPTARATPSKSADVLPDQTTLEERESRALTYRKIYESYLQAYTEIVQRQSYPGTDARVITRADPPTSASSPRVRLTLAAAATLGTLLGLGLALTHMSFDQTVRSSRQIWEKLKVPLLGQVIQLHFFDGFPIWRSLGSRLRNDRSTHPDHRLLIVKNGPNSRTARELRATAVAFKQVAAAQGRSVIGVLGTEPGLNSTAVISNLALLNARVGKRTLLVETDTERPNLMTEFAPQNPCGLEEVLDGNIDVGSTVMPSKQEPMLTLLMARSTGTSAQWTTDQIGKLRVILDQIREQYDLILVHLPPVDVANPASMAVDGVVIVSKAGTTRMRELVDVATGLQIAGNPLLGVIISGLA